MDTTANTDMLGDGAMLWHAMSQSEVASRLATNLEKGVSSVALGLVISFEPHETGVMLRPPRAVDRHIVTGFGLWRIVFVGLALLAYTLVAFFWMKSQGVSDALARTVAVNAMAGWRDRFSQHRWTTNRLLQQVHRTDVQDQRRGSAEIGLAECGGIPA